uniref:Uncharacterized protein n=1 Tax=Buteo japonicus TaxID=224669 RepID=A0A8C0B0B3_9AVES
HGCPRVGPGHPLSVRCPRLELEVSAPLAPFGWPQVTPCPCNVPSYIWSYQHPWVVLGGPRSPHAHAMSPATSGAISTHGWSWVAPGGSGWPWVAPCPCDVPICT